MNRIYTWLASWLAALTALPPAPDPIDAMDARERADLPAMHPCYDG